jgi:cell division protein FtsB
MAGRLPIPEQPPAITLLVSRRQPTDMGAYLKKKRFGEQYSVVHFIAILVATLVLFILYRFISGQAALHQTEKESMRLEEQVIHLEERHTELQQQADYVKSDDYVEYIARTELKWARPGETSVVIVPESHEIVPVEDPNAAENTEGEMPSSPLKAWWRTFFHGPPPEMPPE